MHQADIATDPGEREALEGGIGLYRPGRTEPGRSAALPTARGTLATRRKDRQEAAVLKKLGETSIR